MYYNVDQCGLVGNEDMRGSSDAITSNKKGPVICPKPLTLRWHLDEAAEGYASKGGAGVLDMIFKESNEKEQGNEIALLSSPPFFDGSPPVRAANPLIHDSHFAHEKDVIFPGLSSSSSSKSSSPRKGGRVRMNLKYQPAAVRVQGFDCHVPAVS